MFSRQARSESNVTRSLQRETRGAVFVEYVVLVAFAGLVLALILSTMGPRVVASYSARRALLYSHAP